MKFILDRKFNDSIDILCKKCGELQSKCICNNVNRKILSSNQYTIKSSLKKVKNKIISSFYPFYIDNEKDILSTLKKRLGCGGSIEIIDDYVVINLQGDIIEKAKIELQKLGFNIH